MHLAKHSWIEVSRHCQWLLEPESCHRIVKITSRWHILHSSTRKASWKCGMTTHRKAAFRFNDSIPTQSIQEPSRERDSRRKSTAPNVLRRILHSLERTLKLPSLLSWRKGLIRILNYSLTFGKMPFSLKCSRKVRRRRSKERLQLSPNPSQTSTYPS